MTHHLSLLLLAPLTGALLLALMPVALAPSARWVAALVSVAVLGLAVPLWWLVAPPAGGFQLAERVPWIPSVGAEYSLGIDGFSALLMLLAAIMGAVAMLGLWSASIPRPRSFFATLLALQAAVLGAFAARDSLLFFVCWEAALAAIYLLMRGWNSGEAAATALAPRFLVHAGIASAAPLAALATFYRDGVSPAGLRSFDMAALQTLNIGFSAQWWAFLLLFAGFLLAVPLFFIRGSLEEKNAPVAVLVTVRTIVFTVGLYGFIRIALPALPDAARWFSPSLSAVAAAGILGAAGMSLRQREFAPTLAYVSFSQMATALLGVLVLNSVGLTGSMVQIMTHALSVGALLWLGVMASAGGAPFRVMTLAMIGVPAFGGFVAVFLILQGALSTHVVWAAAAAGGALMASASMLRLHGNGTPARHVAAAGVRERGLRELVLVAPLVLIALGFGLYPAPLLERLAPPVRQVVGRVSPDQPATAADCDTTVTPAMKAANPAAQFLEAAPCGPDGQPLPAAAGSPP